MLNKLVNLMEKCNFLELNKDSYQKILIALLKDDFTINSITCGSSKIVLNLEEIDFIIKIPFYGNRNTAISCKKEIKVYEIAEWQGLTKFYLPLVEIPVKDNYYIYLQEKVISFHTLNNKENKEMFSKEVSDSITELLIDKKFNFYNPQALKSRNFTCWLSYLKNYYDETEMLKFLDFFTWPIFRQDVFGDNLGIHPKDNRPVIIDYAD